MAPSLRRGHSYLQQSPAVNCDKFRRIKSESRIDESIRGVNQVKAKTWQNFGNLVNRCRDNNEMNAAPSMGNDINSHQLNPNNEMSAIIEAEHENERIHTEETYEDVNNQACELEQSYNLRQTDKSGCRSVNVRTCKSLFHLPTLKPKKSKTLSLHLLHSSKSTESVNILLLDNSVTHE